jgi:hypothetical protein
LEQLPQADQAVTTQSIGQLSVAQGLVCTISGHLTPPKPASIVMERSRVMVPPPQDLEHWLKAAHPLTWQLTGQACMLQSRTWERVGHLAPPCWTGVTTERRRVLRPPPQEMVHALKALQPETSQSTGQALLLQSTTFLRAWQRLPPKAAGTMIERVEALEPPPQVLVQLLNAVQPECWQWMGQCCVPQSRSSYWPGHLRPPYLGAMLIERLRNCAPVPQVLEQADQAAQSLTTQWIGHLATSQLSVWLRAGQM